MKPGTSGVKKNILEKAPWLWEEVNLVIAKTWGFLKCYFICIRPDREAKDLLYGKIASGIYPWYDQGQMMKRLTGVHDLR
jgi:hypothetical protein